MRLGGSALIRAIDLLGSGSMLNPKDCIVILFLASHIDDRK